MQPMLKKFLCGFFAIISVYFVQIRRFYEIMGFGIGGEILLLVKGLDGEKRLRILLFYR